MAGFTSSSPDDLGEITTFTNTSNGSNLTFEWDFGDGSPIVTAPNPTHTYAMTGTFAVIITATNSAGVDTAIDSVTICNVSVQPSLRGYWTLDESGGFRLDGSYHQRACRTALESFAAPTPGHRRWLE